MKNTWKIVIVAALVLAVVVTLALKNSRSVQVRPGKKDFDGETIQKRQSLPQLVDLGADKCVPCKMMAPILEELAEKYQDRLVVTFIDVWKNPSAGRYYGIRVIPTQIFIDETGRELFRHEGFFSREDILAKWRELGYKL